MTQRMHGVVCMCIDFGFGFGFISYFMHFLFMHFDVSVCVSFIGWLVATWTDHPRFGIRISWGTFVVRLWFAVSLMAISLLR